MSTSPPVTDATVLTRAESALQTLDAVLARTSGGARWLIHRRVLVVGGDAADDLATLLACHGAQVVFRRATGPLAPAEETRAVTLRLRELVRSGRRSLWPQPLIDREHGNDASNPRRRALASWEGDELVAAYELLVTVDLLGRVADLAAAADWLAARLCPRAPALHWIDTRDRRGDGHPLEPLCLDAAAFHAAWQQSGGACGNRWRPAAMRGVLQDAGFEVGAFEVADEADPDGLAALLPRLHADFAGMSAGSLMDLTGWLSSWRRRPVSSEFPLPTDHPQTLAHSRCRYSWAARHVAGKQVLDVGAGAGLGSRFLLDAGAARVVGVERRPEALALTEMGRGGPAVGVDVVASDRALAAAPDPEDGAPGSSAAGAAPTGGAGAVGGADPAGAATLAPGHPVPGGRHQLTRADLEQGLPFADASFDVVVALEVLEHVRGQGALLDELRRVLRPGGVALVSVPHLPFERMWTELAGEANPYHLHVPGIDEFREMLAGFADVELAGQVDMVASVVVPLGGGAGAGASRAAGGAAGDGGDATAGGEPIATTEGAADAGSGPAADAERVVTELQVPARVVPTDAGTVTIVATAWRDGRPAGQQPAGPAGAFAFGDHQSTLSGGMQETRRLLDELQDVRGEAFAARSELRWAELEGESAFGDGRVVEAE